MKHVQIMQWNHGFIIRSRCTCDPAMPHVTEVGYAGDLPTALATFRARRREAWSLPYPVHVTLTRRLTAVTPTPRQLRDSANRPWGEE
jgi:hypothetical protein